MARRDGTKELMNQLQAEGFQRQVVSILAWCNTFVSRRGLKATTLDDFSDGVLLINLLELTYGTSLGPYKPSAECKLDFHKLDNMSHAFDFMHSQHVLLISVNTNDIVKKNHKATLNILWNLLRALTVRNIAALTGSTVKGKDQDASVRQGLLDWASQSFKSLTNIPEITDFWTSFQNGIAFSAIIEKLAPGHIDVASLKPENAKENLTQAFKIAEEHLGIPSLLNPDDFAPDKRPDEKSVENYVCMLVSAAQGKARLDAQVHELKQQMERDAATKQEEVQRLKEKAEVEKQQVESLQSNLHQLQSMNQEVLQKEQQLQVTLQQTQVEYAQIQQKLAQENSVKEQQQVLIQAQEQQLQASKQQENSLATELEECRKLLAQRDEQIRVLTADLGKSQQIVSDLNSKNAELTTTLAARDEQINGHKNEIAELKEKVVELTETEETLRRSLQDYEKNISVKEEEITNARSEIVRSKSEQRELLQHFQSDMKERAFMSRSGSMTSDTALSELFLASIRDNKGYKDFMNALKDKSGWLMKRRPGKGGVKIFGGNTYKKRYLELKGDTLFYYKEKGEKPQGKANLKNYKKIDFDLGTFDPDTDLYKTKRASVSIGPDGKPIDRIVLKLVPKESVSGAKIMELTPVDSLVAEYQIDIRSWIEEINTRIALIDYLTEMFEKGGAAKSSREIVDFVTDSKQTVLKISDKVHDLHRALHHFKECLIMRKGLSIVLTNVALIDQCVDIIGEILTRNHTVELLDLSKNLITTTGANALAQALRINRSLKSLILSQNPLKDAGVASLASAFEKHTHLEVCRLCDVGMGDQGAIAFIKAITDNMKFPSIELSSNLVSDGACFALGELLRRNPTVTSVFLDSNVVSDAGVQHIASALASGKTHLKFLNLCHNTVSNGGISAISNALKTFKGTFSVDFSENKLIGRHGVSSMLEITDPLEFELFKVLRA